ncbi:MAG: SGNH/GDSL hydrolase family protein [Actinomycetota bacterium]
MKPITFAVLGDSAASGVGDHDVHGVARGWSYYLAQAFAEPIVYLNVSRPGAKSNDVKNVQLNQVIVHQPDITAIIVGGNDLLRNGFNPQTLYENVRETARILVAKKSEILLLQLHDPTEIIPLPKTLARILKRRVNHLNEVTERIAEEFGAILVRSREIPDVYSKSMWHVDRMHPSRYGHQILASEFRKLLVDRNWKIDDIHVSPPQTLTSRESWMWMLKKGTPWFLKRSVDLLPAAIALCAMEFLKFDDPTSDYLMR